MCLYATNAMGTGYFYRYCEVAALELSEGEQYFQTSGCLQSLICTASVSEPPSVLRGTDQCVSFSSLPGLSNVLCCFHVCTVTLMLKK